MATGRTLPAFQRVYIDGYDMSGYTNETGEQGIDLNEAPSLCLADAITGYLPTKPTVSVGPITGVFDNTATSGIHVLADAAKGTARKILIASGVRAAPVFGDDVFCAQMLQKAYKQVGQDRLVGVRMDFEHDAIAGMLYTQPWGKLLHAMGAESGVNTSDTNVDNGAATTGGCWFMCQVYSITGAGTVTLYAEDSANGTAWGALTGGGVAVATASAPTATITQHVITATVRRYLRWQLQFGGSATACTFAMGFMRG